MNFGKYRKKVTISLAISLHDRMTQYYESVTHSRTLTRRMPVIIRCDMECGKAFTNKLKKPWDDVFSEAMQRTVCDMAEKIQGCVLGYTASDEISLLLLDYQELNTDAWFGYNVDKLVSSAASMATIFFYKNFVKGALLYENSLSESEKVSDSNYLAVLDDKVQKRVLFLMQEHSIFQRKKLRTISLTDSVILKRIASLCLRVIISLTRRLRERMVLRCKIC